MNYYVTLLYTISYYALNMNAIADHFKHNISGMYREGCNFSVVALRLTFSCPCGAGVACGYRLELCEGVLRETPLSTERTGCPPAGTRQEVAKKVSAMPHYCQLYLKEQLFLKCNIYDIIISRGGEQVNTITVHILFFL